MITVSLTERQLQAIVSDEYCPPEQVFFSRRNRVCRKRVSVDTGVLEVVVKEHKAQEGARDEFRILKMLDSLDIKVPKVYGYSENKICSAYIPGILLASLVDDYAASYTSWIPRLASWYAHFHQATITSQGLAMLKDDNNLRNFIYYKGDFYGLDFEGPVYGSPQYDIGRCIAYILTNTPAFTRQKFAMADYLIEHYITSGPAVSLEDLYSQIQAGLQELAGQRPQQREEILTNLPYLRMAVFQ